MSALRFEALELEWLDQNRMSQALEMSRDVGDVETMMRALRRDPQPNETVPSEVPIEKNQDEIPIEPVEPENAQQEAR